MAGVLASEKKGGKMKDEVRRGKKNARTRKDEGGKKKEEKEGEGRKGGAGRRRKQSMTCVVSMGHMPDAIWAVCDCRM